MMSFWGLDVEIVLANKTGKQKAKPEGARGGRDKSRFLFGLARVIAGILIGKTTNYKCYAWVII